MSIVSPETRAKISATLKGHSVSAETREKIGAAQKGKKFSPERLAKRIGKKLSDETRAKMSEAHKGKKVAPRSLEHRAKLSALHMGNHYRLKHGHAITYHVSRTYQTWQGMIRRCTNPNVWNWKNYGGRFPNPVTIEDERWSSFVNFLSDMGERPDGMSIDRIKNDLGYFKENCRWATASEQAFNRRPKRIAA